MTNPVEVTLATLANGDLMECAAVELRRICDNIADPNIPTEAKRKLTITIEIKPDASGQMAAINYDVVSSLPRAAGGRTVAHIAMAPGTHIISFFEVESQPPLFAKEEPLVELKPRQA